MHSVHIKSLDIAVINAVRGGSEQLAHLKSLVEGAGAGDIDHAISIVVDSSSAREENFLPVLELLVSKSRGGEYALKQAMASSHSKAAVFLVNSYATEAQKSDFFTICKTGDNKAIMEAIKQFGAGFANKAIDELGRTGLHIAIINSGRKVI